MSIALCPYNSFRPCDTTQCKPAQDAGGVCPTTKMIELLAEISGKTGA
ncbi:MAG: hypothetical protein UY48_C0046G0005 [Candidatus Gottesmanbacteria bacterium GW2011_GWB1_49_7]|uniref:Uncharacterized protein n=1 Tax=Candidatus Gottesmanbacteria bacterium GW2011_GWB1_49_7 TaxID=1618448 RepID=A0A0G1VUQ8_9BACT|nr:MAG: hypothetical protein UY48_C0046G0005 [Candidatus Gottesmanbacteria bacterium GW2011_GWB1_49_7]